MPQIVWPFSVKKFYDLPIVRKTDSQMKRHTERYIETHIHRHVDKQTD